MTKTIDITHPVPLLDVRKLVSAIGVPLDDRDQDKPHVLVQPVPCDVGATRVVLPLGLDVGRTLPGLERGERLIASTTDGVDHHGVFAFVPWVGYCLELDAPLDAPVTFTTVRRPTEA